MPHRLDRDLNVHGAFELKAGRLSFRTDLARLAQHCKRAGEHKPVLRCACCKRSERDGVKVFVEMGAFVACDGCIEAAAQIVAEQKARP
jgi:hypothetical protein